MKKRKQATSSFQKHNRKMDLTRGISRLQITSFNQNFSNQPYIKNHFKILKSISTARGKCPKLNNYLEKVVTSLTSSYLHLSKIHLNCSHETSLHSN